jgi:hypothetical protein
LGVFCETNSEKLFTRDIVALLRTGTTESAVLKYSSIDDYQISKTLRPYGIKPVCIRIGREVSQGYQSDDFRDAVTRYVSEADREVYLKGLERRVQLQREAEEEVARSKVLFEKVKQMLPPGQKMTEAVVKEMLQKIKDSEQRAEGAGDVTEGNKENEGQLRLQVEG